MTDYNLEVTYAYRIRGIEYTKTLTYTFRALNHTEAATLVADICDSFTNPKSFQLQCTL
jgi:hypothetical protein